MLPSQPKPGGLAERGCRPCNPDLRKDLNIMRKRSCGIHVRVTEQEKRQIEINARKCSMTVSNYMRQIAFKHEPKTLPREEILEIYQNISRLKTSLSHDNPAVPQVLISDIQRSIFVLCFPEDGDK